MTSADKLRATCNKLISADYMADDAQSLIDIIDACEMAPETAPILKDDAFEIACRLEEGVKLDRVLRKDDLAKAIYEAYGKE